MTKSIFTLAICSALGGAAYAHSGDAACVPTASDTGESVYYTPIASTESREPTDAEKRSAWIRAHTPAGPVRGNMSGAAGTSALSYLHGTDEPQGHLLGRTDEGPSSTRSIRNRSSANDELDDF